MTIFSFSKVLTALDTYLPLIIPGKAFDKKKQNFPNSVSFLLLI